MDPRSSNRQKTTTGNSKGVHRRGEGLGTGPVGRQDAYAGRKASSAGGRTAKVGGGSGTLILIIIIVFLSTLFYNFHVLTIFIVHIRIFLNHINMQSCCIRIKYF